MAQPEYTTFPEVVAWWRLNPTATIHECKKALRVGPEKAAEARAEALATQPVEPVEAPPSAPEGYGTTPAFSGDVPYSTVGTAPASGPARAPDNGGNGTLTRAIEGETSRAGIGLELPASPRARWDDYPQIEAGVLWLSDLHVPVHRKDWIERAVAEALKRNIRRLIIGGDFFDLPHWSKWGGPPDYSFESVELPLGQTVMKWLLQYFTRVDFLLGNHDARAGKKLDHQLSTRRLMQLIFPYEDRVFVHRQHHAYVGETWLVSHPGVYSRMPAKPAYDLCAKFQRNVAVGHTHKWAMTRDVSGKYWAVETGMCLDARLTQYTHEELRTFPAQQNGALIITEDERPVALHPDLL